MLARTPALEADRDAAFRRTVERLDTLGKMDFTVPASLKATLRATRSTAISGSARLSTWALAASWPTIWAWAKHCR